MVRFFKNALLFFLILSCVCIGVELYLLTVPNQYSYKKNYLENHGDRIKVLILGHSQTVNGIIPDVLGDSVFNMATQGRYVYYDAEIAKRWLHLLPNLECVIWPLGYDFHYDSYKYPLGGRRDKHEDSQVSTYRCMFEKYMGIRYADGFPCSYWPELLYSRLDYGKRLFGGSHEDLCQCDSSGFEALAVESKAPGWKHDRLPAPISYDDPNLSLSVALNIAYMKTIAQACRAAGARLIVVSMPYYKTYTALMTPRGLRDMHACADSMKSAYPALEYYDFVRDARFTDDDFYDPSHLTVRGAQKFSTIFREECLR